MILLHLPFPKNSPAERFLSGQAAHINTEYVADDLSVNVAASIKCHICCNRQAKNDMERHFNYKWFENKKKCAFDVNCNPNSIIKNKQKALSVHINLHFEINSLGEFPLNPCALKSIWFNFLCVS